MSRVTEDLTGQRFGKLTVIGIGGRYKSSGNLFWNCECDCGNTTHTTGYSLKTGKSVSCGRCSAAERATERNYKHGGFGTRLYEIWRQMHRRCYGQNTKAYKDYGDRGITVCNEWYEFEPFRIWAISNGYSDDLTIDRINVDGDYSPENCRWATKKQQANNRRNNHNIEYDGEVHTVSEWADILGIEQVVLRQKLIRCGWDIGTIKAAKKGAV